MVCFLISKDFAMTSNEVASNPEVLNDANAASRILSFVAIFSIFSIELSFLALPIGKFNLPYGK